MYPLMLANQVYIYMLYIHVFRNVYVSTREKTSLSLINFHAATTDEQNHMKLNSDECRKGPFTVGCIEIWIYIYIHKMYIRSCIRNQNKYMVKANYALLLKKPLFIGYSKSTI